ncbi:hypothetical protein ACKKBG_A38360 [Auxenochlorella protothecoides x Auxenochlorella symbiontica]
MSRSPVTRQALDAEGRALLQALVARLAAKLSPKLLEAEFLALGQEDAAAVAAAAAAGGFSAATGCMERNRYSDVLPFDDHRIRLRREPSPGDAGTVSDPLYINASPLEGAPGDVPWHLTLAQAPLRSTREHFWQMVFECQHTHVVSLTNPVENGVVKSSAYLAEEAGWKRRFGGMAVKTEGVSEAHAKLWLRRLSLRGGGGPPPRPVWHWHYAAWPDHGVPASPEALLRLVGELAPVQTPILAHCSAGIGRSGVFAVLLVAVRRAEAALSGTRPASAEDLADLRGLVAACRAQRAGCVQTLAQYAFVHTALKRWAGERLGDAEDQGA